MNDKRTNVGDRSDTAAAFLISGRGSCIYRKAVRSIETSLQLMCLPQTEIGTPDVGEWTQAGGQLTIEGMVDEHGRIGSQRFCPLWNNRYTPASYAA